MIIIITCLPWIRNPKYPCQCRQTILSPTSCDELTCKTQNIQCGQVALGAPKAINRRMQVSSSVGLMADKEFQTPCCQPNLAEDHWVPNMGKSITGAPLVPRPLNLPAAQASLDPEPHFEASPYRAYAATKGMVVVPAVGEGSWANTNHESVRVINIELMQSSLFFSKSDPSAWWNKSMTKQITHSNQHGRGWASRSWLKHGMSFGVNNLGPISTPLIQNRLRLNSTHSPTSVDWVNRLILTTLKLHVLSTVLHHCSFPKVESVTPHQCHQSVSSGLTLPRQQTEEALPIGLKNSNANVLTIWWNIFGFQIV